MRLAKAAVRRRIKPFVYRFRSRLLYRAASFYVNAVDNDNDSDFRTNGEEAFARATLRGAKLVFDIGAARGDWTKIALAAEPNLVVHCFEPESHRFKILSERGFGAGTVLNKLGVGETPTETRIFCNASGGSNSLYPQRYEGQRYHDADVETVTITTIDSYCRQHEISYVDFIKMDIEGNEPAALRGAEQMLRAGNIGVIQFEYSAVFLDAGSSLLHLMRYVRDINPRYEFHKILPDGTRMIPAYQHTLDNFKTQNWALIKRA